VRGAARKGGPYRNPCVLPLLTAGHHYLQLERNCARSVLATPDRIGGRYRRRAEMTATGHPGSASPGGRQITLEPGPPLGELAARQMLEHLTGDVALQDPDNFTLGTTLFRPPFHVGA
jgi:hypothetical protein